MSEPIKWKYQPPELITCWKCDGTGSVVFRNFEAPGLPSLIAAKCPVCDGNGRLAFFASDRGEQP